LRKKLKGWSRNLNAGIKKRKASTLVELDALDKLAEHQTLCD
jgi:hypothetical protein